METYRTFTPFDPEAREDQSAVKMAFVTQAVLDIQWKLQQLDGFAGKQLAELGTIEEEVPNNR